jgi:Rrf2 family iron-sulfur cluster assembly transcriptional regulator
MISKSCEYGIKAVICISVNTLINKRISLARVAENIKSPMAFTSKILQQLVRAEIVQSSKGSNGGFVINQQKIEKLTMWDVVNAIDGNELEHKCILGLGSCSEENPCPVHSDYSVLRKSILHFMNSTFIIDLSKTVSDGESVLKSPLLMSNLKLI